MVRHPCFRRSDIVFAYPPEAAKSMIHVNMVWFPCGKIAFTSASDFNNGANRKMMSAVIFNNSYAVALLNFHVTPPIVHIITLFCRSQVHQLHDFAVHHLMVPQSAERRADNTDSRISDKIVRDEFAVAQKILAIFIINSVHIVLQR